MPNNEYNAGQGGNGYMAQIIQTEPALDNLNGIAEYIVVSNAPAAKKLIKNIFGKVQRLEQSPEP